MQALITRGRLRGSSSGRLRVMKVGYYQSPSPAIRNFSHRAHTIKPSGSGIRLRGSSSRRLRVMKNVMYHQSPSPTIRNFSHRAHTMKPSGSGIRSVKGFPEKRGWQGLSSSLISSFIACHRKGVGDGVNLYKPLHLCNRLPWVLGVQCNFLLYD